MLEPLLTAAAPLPGAGSRGLPPTPPASLPRCYRSPPCLPGRCPAALPLRDLLPSAATPLFGRKGHPPPLSPPSSPGLKPLLTSFQSPGREGEELRGGRVFPGRAPFNNRTTTETTRRRSPPPGPQRGSPGFSSGGRQRCLRHVSPPQAARRPRRLRALPPGAPAPRRATRGARSVSSPPSQAGAPPGRGEHTDACAAELGVGFEGSHRLLFLLSPPSLGELLPNFSSGPPLPPWEPQTPSLTLSLPKAFWALSC